MSVPLEVMLIIACLAFYGTVYCTDAQECNPRDRKPLKDVKLDEVSRPWFAHWYMENKENSTYEKIVSSFFLKDAFNMDIKGSQKVVVGSKVRYRDTVCFYDVVSFLPTGEPSSWKPEHHTTDVFRYVLEWRILDTDKIFYMVNWICFRFSEIDPKLCIHWAVIVMTRGTYRQILKSDWNKIVKSIVDYVCEERLFEIRGFDIAQEVCNALEICDRLRDGSDIRLVCRH